MVKETGQDDHREVLEEGHIYFLYRPKVRAKDEEEVAAEDLGDVENFYLDVLDEAALTVGHERQA
jgi:hypothetical protein